MSTGGKSPNPLPLLLGERHFVFFLAARVSNLLATQMLTVAIGWQVYDLTESALSLGYVGLAQFAPAIFLFLLAGLVADRFERRNVLMACYALQCIAALLFLTNALSGSPQAWPIYATLLVYGSARAFLNPATRALLPNLVPRALFPNAVACNSSLSKLAALTGPLVGGVTIAAFGYLVYGLIAALFAAGILAAASIRVRTARGAAEPVRLGILFAGILYIRRSQVLWGAMTLDLVAVLFGTILGLLPVFAKDVLGVGPGGFGLLRAMPAVGAFGVAACLAYLPALRNTGSLLFTSLVVYGVSILVFGLSTSFLISLLALAGYGAADMLSVCIRQTLVQIATPDAMRGRVGALDSVFTNGSEELGNFRSGLTAAAFGAVEAVLIGGLATIAITTVWWQRFPQLRAVDRLTEQVEETDDDDRKPPGPAGTPAPASGT